jgi:excisionase family DNA binding protein
MKSKKIENVNENWLNEKQAAEYLKISYSKLRLFVRPKNEIAFHRFGSSIRYSVEDLKTYILKNRIEALN